MNRLSLFEEYRLIERSESEINGVWKGAHLLLFFLAFVFGSFCTFCFHMLMYFFDEKCVLFPKLLSLSSLKHNVIYEILPVDKETADMLPLDFLGTQWVDKKTCYLPTYVPLISAIFGLVWTTMFLMCSTGSRTLTGLQRPWRVLPPVFVFSLAMSCLCMYSSIVTHTGLNQLCQKLGEVTGSSTCTYTVNVATLTYERRIRGVYQAIQVTVFSAWLHTMCWLMSALLTLTRVFLAVDFRLVRVNVELIGDINKMMDLHEKHIQTVSTDVWFNNEQKPPTGATSPVRFKHRTFTQTSESPEQIHVIYKDSNDAQYISTFAQHVSRHGLHPDESHRLARLAAYQNIPKDKHFIVKIVYDLILNLPSSDTSTSILTLSEDTYDSGSETSSIARQAGQSKLDTFNTPPRSSKPSIADEEVTEEVAKDIRRRLYEKQITRLREENEPEASTSKSYPQKSLYQHESILNITQEMKNILESKLTKADKKPSIKQKSSMKHAGAQTEGAKSTQKVQIAEPEDSEESASNTNRDVDKETQTRKEKEKQD